jgi:subtilase family serine protease
MHFTPRSDPAQMRSLTAVVSVLLASLAVAVPAADAQAPDGVVPTSPSLDLLLGLKRQQGDLARLARAVSDPRSAYYRRYLGVREISRRFGANPDTKRSVKRFFARRGAAAKVDPSGAFATVSLSPAQLRATFGVGASAAASGKTPPAVPEGLRDAVTGISVPAAGPEPEPAQQLPPGISLERTGTPRGCAAGLDAKGIPALPSGGFTPNQMATAHGFAPLHRRGLRGQGRRIALLEYDGGFERGDMDVFARCFGLPKAKLAVRAINGKVPMPGSARNSDEVTLDIQVVMGLAPRAAIDVYEGNATASFGMGFAAALAPRKGQGLPDVISLSYGACELFLTDLAAKSQRRIDRYMIDVATVAGVPILAASMDHGSSGCAEFPVPSMEKRVETSYPSTAQYVTAVGGTSFVLRPDNSILSQRVWNDRVLGEYDISHGAGGGGVSKLISRPWFQRDAGLRRGKGRLVPDLSLYSDPIPGWAIYCSVASCGNLGWLAVGGTSAATPAFAAGIALVNQDAKRHRQPRVGAVNPLLYELARSPRSPFRDVVLGDNDVYGVGCCKAHRGFDRASGWGSLDMARFSAAARRTYARR